MTDHLDDLASAHLDGATTPDEAARVTADPTLLARVEELRAVRNAVAAAVPPPDPERREAAIAAALIAFAEDGEPAVERSAPAVTSLASVAARRGPSPRVVQVLGAAAAVALLALLVPLLGSLGGSDDDAASGGLDATADGARDSGEADVQSESPQEAAQDRATTTLAAPGTDLRALDDLGAYDDFGSLVVAARGSQQRGAGLFDATASAESSGCLADLRAALEADDSTITYGWTATLRSREVLVVFTRSPAAESVLVYDSVTCAPIIE